MLQLPYETAPEGVVQRVRTAVGDEAWLVVGHAEVRALLADDRLGRAHPEPATAARQGRSALFGGPLGDFDTEATDHARMRSLLQPLFSPRRMRALTPRIGALTAALLDELSSPSDLVDGLAVPLPILVICELLGVPYADRDRFRAWSQAAADTVDEARSHQGLGELFAYGQRLVGVKRREPGDDVISRLSEVDGISDDEAAGLAMALLFAGHETTVNQIGAGALLLLRDPDQWRALAKDPSLVSDAVEEIMRAPTTSGGGVPRYARTDFTIGDAAIRTGDLVLLDLSAANHDPAVFAEPDRFDITRSEAGHLAFGHGARYCVGAPLARIELAAVFGELPRRFPGMRLAVPVAKLRYHENTLTGGLTALPVVW